MLLYPESTLQLCSLRSFCEFFKDLFRFPISRQDDVVFHPDAHQSATFVRTPISVQKLRTVQGCLHPEAHLTTVPSIRTTCHTVWTSVRPSIIHPDDVHFHPDPPLCREGSIQLPSVRTFLQHVWTPLSTRPVSDSFQVSIKERSINRPDDVVSRPDACLLKARIAIQISSSGRLSILVRTCMQLIWKLPIRLQSSGRLPLMVWMRA
jgi:hypothetical protein